MDPTTAQTNYASHLAIPYSAHSSLNTLDIHTPRAPTANPTYWLIYVHGGAFRDPLVSSVSLLPSLPSLFANPHIAAIASINYRLSPYPDHPTHPSSPDDEGRNAKWPEHIDDVRDAIDWLKENGGMEGKEWMIAGHSVGGTMALMLSLQAREQEGDMKWGKEGAMEGLKGVISIEGIFDFVAPRDAHLEYREIYDAFTTGAFGSEEDGCWERGNVLRGRRKVREGIMVVLVVHSREDELVEWEQAEQMVQRLEEEKGKRDGVGVLMEVNGKHQEIVTEGVVIGKVVDQALRMLIKRGKGES